MGTSLFVVAVTVSLVFSSLLPLFLIIVISIMRDVHRRVREDKSVKAPQCIGFTELAWMPEKDRQAEDMIFRIGQ
jgi:hypothetical protein